MCIQHVWGRDKVTWGLQLGKIVIITNVYGVATAKKNPDQACMLKLCMDFDNNICEFKISDTKYSFKDSVNMILQKLYE